MTIEDVQPAPATEDTTATRWTTARADDQAARRALLMADLSESGLKAEQADLRSASERRRPCGRRTLLCFNTVRTEVVQHSQHTQDYASI